MSRFLPFDEIKAKVTLEDAMRLLGLEMNERNGQWRGHCPACKDGSHRTLVVTPGRGFFCQYAKKGGADAIALVFHVKEFGKMNEAAEWIVERIGEPEEAPVKAPAPSFDKFKESLQTEHEALNTLGISSDTCKFFEAGIVTRGVLIQGKGPRLAIPIHDLNGELVAYCGRAVSDDQTPALTFPKDFDPSRYVFNLHRLDGQLTTTNDPLDVLMEYEHTGDTSMVSFLHRPLNVVPIRKRA